MSIPNFALNSALTTNTPLGVFPTSLAGRKTETGFARRRPTYGSSFTPKPLVGRKVLSYRRRCRCVRAVESPRRHCRSALCACVWQAGGQSVVRVATSQPCSRQPNVGLSSSSSVGDPHPSAASPVCVRVRSRLCVGRIVIVRWCGAFS